jgi:hypothetical protein
MPQGPRKATIWYSHGGGRFGNQMLRFAHLIAWVEEHRGHVELINLAAWPYMNLVAGYGLSAAGIYPPRRSMLNVPAKLIGLLPEKLGRGAFTLLRERVLNAAGETLRGKPIIRVPDSGRGVDLGDQAFFERCTEDGGAWIVGWKLASWELVRKHGQAVRRHLNIRGGLASPGYRVANDARSEADVVIGVLCRQTDYRVFQAGRFYLEQHDTAKQLEVIRAFYPGKRVRFMVTGDEVIDPVNFPNLPIVISSGSQGMGGHFIESIAALSRCDLVVGPPSTFAAWAAFLGSRPYLPILAERVPAETHILNDALADAAADPICSLAVI